jgi:hypothetical protein
MRSTSPSFIHALLLHLGAIGIGLLCLLFVGWIAFPILLGLLMLIGVLLGEARARARSNILAAGFGIGFGIGLISLIDWVGSNPLARGSEWQDLRDYFLDLGTLAWIVMCWLCAWCLAIAIEIGFSKFARSR